MHFVENFLHIPQNISQWPPFEIYVNGSAIMEDDHDPLNLDAKMAAQWPGMELLDLNSDKTASLLIQAGGGLLEGDGITGALKDLTNGTNVIDVVYEFEEILYTSPDVTVAVTGLQLGGLDTVHGCGHVALPCCRAMSVGETKEQSGNFLC